jgi:ABC-type transport system involved in multi-copper enzyme maturation permease subunit
MNHRFKNNWVAIATLTRLTLLESWRGRGGRFLFFTLIAVQLLASFVVEMAVTESNDVRLTTAAFLYRLCFLFALGVGMIASVVREHESGFVYVLLAHPVSRMHYVLGRMLGYAVVALVTTLAVMGVMAIWTPMAQWDALAVWSMSLWLELIVMGSVALFFALGLRNMVGSMVMWLAFYVLARVLDVARTMSATPIGQDPHGLAAITGQWTFNVLGWVIPPLGNFTLSEWLVGNMTPSLESLWILALWAIAYAAICTVGAAIDFYRHEV